MVRERNGRLSLRGGLPAGVDIVEYEAQDEPLFPKSYSLTEYNNVARKAKEASGYISVLIDDAARERANDAHRMLTNLVAKKIRGAGFLPKNNRYVDLSAVVEDDLYLFEMKSTTTVNVHSQIRRAISQLYEYRYLQQVPAAKLVVVIENPPPPEKKWIVDYMVKDRRLLIAWDGDGKTLQYPTETGADLNFLSWSLETNWGEYQTGWKSGDGTFPQVEGTANPRRWKFAASPSPLFHHRHSVTAITDIQTAECDNAFWLGQGRAVPPGEPVGAAPKTFSAFDLWKLKEFPNLGRPSGPKPLPKSQKGKVSELSPYSGIFYL
jgi:hypothetical protein